MAVGKGGMPLTPAPPLPPIPMGGPSGRSFLVDPVIPQAARISEQRRCDYFARAAVLRLASASQGGRDQQVVVARRLMQPSGLDGGAALGDAGGF